MKVKNYLLSLLLLLPLVLQAQNAAPPVMGWSSWNTYRVHISDKLIMQQADAMKAKGLGKVGYKFINIDDGYFGGRDENGTLKTHPERFPNGLQEVVQHIHKLGFKAGIYSDAGCNTCGHFWDKDKAGENVGLYGYDAQDAKLFFNDLKFDFIKIDFCGGDAKQNTQQLALDEKTRYSEIRKAIDDTGRKDVKINVCRWAFPGSWVYDVGSSWRISPDIHVEWWSIKSIINRNLYLSAYAGNGHYNDMDMLEVGRGLGEVVDLTHFGMWCIMSSPLLIGCDMTTISDETLALLKNEELIALNQDRLGLQANVIAKQGDVYVLAKDIETLMGKKRALAVYNSGEKEAAIDVKMLEHLNLLGRVKVRDVANKRDLQSIDNNILTVSLPARGSAFYVMEGAKRTEQTRYEAEDAWLEKYNAIDVKDENTAINIARAVSNPLCSGEKGVGSLGGADDNWLEWRRIHSLKGGQYQLTLKYISNFPLSADLIVNGKKYSLKDKKSGGVAAEQKLNIVLNKGQNVIRLSNESKNIPIIDCIELEAIK